ncbi:DUF2808 domain-containing protein [Oscillatoria sp. CS-180]|uniref:DUF2808 domain-containing protein n=1 Tax=Oscillatoria sp. CS-180 TaxID=3021720 RepID=UPI00233132AC|nr:DUF2808 domain-containing protein [Oscillatoria sp. CS-180]MDB9528213.1 DUF2808 domain-containing protein [Oscillatoria sp. CS-180]
MKLKQWLHRSLLGVLAASGLAIAGSTAIAQTTEGLTIFGGVDSEFRLGYYIDNNERRSNDARYYLRVAGGKIPQDILELQISYPEKFEEQGGYFTSARIELREGTGRGGATIEADEIIVDPEANVFEIYPSEPIPANTSFIVVLHDVRNPNRYGNYFFTLDALYQGGPLREFVGVWPLEVAAE